MTRPPLTRTDMANLPPRAIGLVAAGRDLDRQLVPALAEDVDALLLEHCDRPLGDVGPVRARRILLDHLELLRDLGRAVEVPSLHDPHAAGSGPDERVDLVHLPGLVALAERRAVLEHDVDARRLVVAAVGPALQRCR